MTRLHTGDFSTGDFTQWYQIVTKYDTRDPKLWVPAYPAKVICEDADCGYIARFEVRDGDVPSFGGGERSEVFQPEAGAGIIFNDGETVWYAWSIKFDPSFPTQHMQLHMGASHYDGWGVVGQWHGVPADIYDPVLTFGWGGDPAELVNSPGYFGLSQGDPDIPFAARTIVALPMNIGQWNDVKVQVCHSSDPAVGFVRVWYNGVAQTLYGGTTTFTGRTMLPGATGQKIQLGYYRNVAITVTGIVSYANFRMADSEASL